MAAICRAVPVASSPTSAWLGMSGLDLQDRLAEQGIRLPVIVLTAFPRTRSTVRAMKAGALTLLEKPYDEEELWDAIRKALAQDAASRAEAQRRGEIRQRAERLDAGRAQRDESDRPGQAEQDASPSELDLSIRTIESRRHEVFIKMGVESVAELVRLAIEGELAE